MRDFFLPLLFYEYCFVPIALITLIAPIALVIGVTLIFLILCLSANYLMGTT